MPGSQTQTREAAEIEEKLRGLMEALGIKLPPGELRFVSPARAALLDWFDRHAFFEIRLEGRAGEPYLGAVEWEKGVTERFLFGEKA